MIPAKRIVLTSWGSYGDFYPYVGLARTLQERGHRVVLAVPQYFRQEVEREGLEFRRAGPDVDPNDKALIARIMDPVKGPETIIRELVMPALRRSYDELADAARNADLLVSHPITFAGPVLAQRRELPWVSTLLSPMSFFSAFDPPVLPAAPRLIHLRRTGTWFGRLVGVLGRRATREWARPVYDLRAELRLPPGGHPIFEGQFSPLLTLALFSRVLASPQRDWPPHAKTTGFVFYNGPDCLPPVLAEFLDAGSPPVVFTLGSSAVGAAGQFYEESASAARRAGVRAVLLTGGLSENQPASQSDDILVVDRAPHQLLFPRASAVVHQGGIGTTGQALRAGRPMLVVPHSHDQPDNAFRVGHLGVARTVYPTAYRAAAVSQQLARLLENEDYRTRAASVAEVVSAEGGVEAAADAIEGVWRDQPTSA